MTQYPLLSTPIILSGISLKNRVLMGSMHTGLEETGDWNRVAEFYATRARGGVGLMVTGGIAPNRAGAVFPHAAGLYTEADIANHRIVTSRVHEAGGRIAMQILHAGRYAYGKDCVSASAVKSPISPFTPQELTPEGIEKQIADIVCTAERAREAGYDGVEIMGSEGYFLNQFIVRHTNRRSDDWGGDYENRIRLPIEVVRRVRAALGQDFIIIFRISLIDLVPNGSTWEEVEILAKAIEAAGASVLNTGIGWHEARVPTIATSVPRRAFSWLTGRLRKAVSIPVIASNRINTPEVAEAILAEGEADMISMARPLLADPDFMRKALAGRSDEIAPCIGCNQACLDHTFSGQLTTCLVNPRACYETELTYAPTQSSRRIAVVGAGPAGMMAAIVAATRGHNVTLYERAEHTGGLLNLARKVPGKEEFDGLVAWFDRMLSASGVDLRLGTKATPEMLVGYDEVIVATGVIPRDPQIPTEPGAHVLGYAEVLEGAPTGAKVVIAGAGGIGFDVAEYLTTQGVSPTLDLELWKREWGVSDPQVNAGGLAPEGPQPHPSPRSVTLVQRKPEKPGRRLGKTTGWIHRAALAMKDVGMRGGMTYERITPAGLEVSTRNGEELLEADTIVLCTGQEPSRALAEALIAAGITPHIIGGADVAAELDAKRAIHQAAQLAASL